MEETENLKNPQDTVEQTETVKEQGTVVENNDTPKGETEEADSKEVNQAIMRKNQLENQAKELEEATGMKLEELLATVRNPQEESTVETTEVNAEDIDVERFNELTLNAVKAKYGDLDAKLARLEKIDKRFADAETKEDLASLPSDWKEYESDMAEIIEKNKGLGQTREGVLSAYYAAKGKNLDKIIESAKKDTTGNIKETEEVKKVAFIEEGKNTASTEKSASLKDILNLPLSELAKIPKEEREKILKSLQ